MNITDMIKKDPNYQKHYFAWPELFVRKARKTSSNILQNYLETYSETLSHEEIENLKRLEQYIAWIYRPNCVAQGLWICALKKKHTDIYIAMVYEIKWREDGDHAQSLREAYKNRTT